MRILLSINPRYVEKIFSGEKQYEYRRRVCRLPINEILIYETAPVMKIVGNVEIVDIIIGEPEEVWRLTHKNSGIPKILFDDYFNRCQKAVAYKLGNVTRYENPEPLSLYGIVKAPQSFVYIKST